MLAPLYFPRNQLEESSALWQLPKNISGISGELSISDRQIRITRNPQHIMMLGSELKIFAFFFIRTCHVGIVKLKEIIESVRQDFSHENFFFFIMYAYDKELDDKNRCFS